MEEMPGLRVVNVSPEQRRESVTEEQECDTLLSSPSLMPLSNESFFRPPNEYHQAMSSLASQAPASVFDIIVEPYDEQNSEPTTAPESGFDDTDAEKDLYNLQPPRAMARYTDLEALMSRLFSVDHLEEILREPGFARKFAHFLAKYLPGHSSKLDQYVEARKAMAAIEYANSIARATYSANGQALEAAVINHRFETQTRQLANDLVEEALPSYLTRSLTSLITDTLVKNITGKSSPIMHELIPCLAEVYCMTDPSMPDSPIVYASEEFYNLTQYGKEYVIGRNCRFLQGPGTSATSIRRLIEALGKGEEFCETILNYRRDGTAFVNLLTVAPLYDNKGVVRYFLGCQIDVTSLVENGRGLESFAQLLSQDGLKDQYGHSKGPDTQQSLSQLSQLFTEEEADVVRRRMRRSGIMSRPRISSQLSFSNRTDTRYGESARSSRIVLGVDETGTEASQWPYASLGFSSRLPGVYQNYMLVRPYPSLRITFTSATLRIPGLLQTKLLDKIDAPPMVREGLIDAFSHGTSVTAKITWLTSGSHASEGKARWIHCTPLLGGDDRVGVWMVVMVEDEHVTGSLNTYGMASRTSLTLPTQPPGADHYTVNKLYSDYLKREGRTSTAGSRHISLSMRERREADGHFRDF